MYYRVKQYRDSYSNMYVLDKDDDLSRLKSRINIDCAGLGPWSFSSPRFLESQIVRCVSQGGESRKSDIIEDL